MNSPLNDLGLQLRRVGYDALPRAWQSQNADTSLWATLLGRRTLVVRGAEGARLLYDSSVVRRSDAVPRPLADLLFGRGAVHGLDGEEHRRRKGLMLSVLSPEQTGLLVEEVATRLDLAIERWRTGLPVPLYDELVRVYGAAALSWAGTGTTGRSADLMSRDLAAIVDGFGFALPAYPRAWAARRRCNAWAAELVSEVRAGRCEPPVGSPLQLLAEAEDILPSASVAGVELLNLVRPMVAVAWFGCYAAAELTSHPGLGPALAHPVEGRELRRSFVTELRRLCPFVPALAGRVCAETQWHGERLQPGDRIVLDVPGTNTDIAAHRSPDVFEAERYLTEEPDPFTYVAQGGGDVHEGHRCPGEHAAVGILAETVQRLASSTYRIWGPTLDRHRMPPAAPTRYRLQLETC